MRICLFKVVVLILAEGARRSGERVQEDETSEWCSLCLYSAASSVLLCFIYYVSCVVVVSTAQPQLPRGEAALRVPAQQAGPHQAANSRFRPEPSAVVLSRY